MQIFITGATGYLAGEMLVNLSKREDVERIYCLVRAHSPDEAQYRIRKVFQLHCDGYDEKRIVAVMGDLTQTGLADYLAAHKELRHVNMLVHAAANTSFAKISEEAVERVNILGLNEIVWWAKTLKDLHTFAYVGTATIIGKDAVGRVVHEDESPNLRSRHFVKYTYTKMLGEVILRENLPPEKVLVMRPSIVMGDSRPVTPRSYVIMWAVAAANMLRMVPVEPESALDIVSVDYAADAMARLLFARRTHSVYHISAGVESATTARKLTEAIAPSFNDRPEFLFVKRHMIAQMKHWARGRLRPDSELHQFPRYLDYWERTFDDRPQLRILLSGFEPYAEFIELSQVFDNTRLLADVDICAPEPAHRYLERCSGCLNNIDVLEGALDP